MKHLANPSFWKCYNDLPKSIKKLANKNFDLLKQNSNHPSLHFKKINQYWSVRIGKKYRALAAESGDDLIWFWIGDHSEYKKLL